MTSALEELGRQIAAEQDAILARDGAAGLARVRHRVLSPPPARVPLGRGFALALAALAVGAAVAVAVALWPAGEPDLGYALADGTPGHAGATVAAADAPLTLDFTDGSSVTLAPTAQITVASLDERGASLVLDSGRASFAVTPGHATRWSVGAGAFTVHVTGTRFDVAWSPRHGEFVLELTEGHVLVTGPSLGQGRHVMAGERVRVSIPEDRVEFGAVAAAAADADRWGDGAAAAGAPRGDDAVAEAAAPRAHRAAAAPSAASPREERGAGEVVARSQPENDAAVTPGVGMPAAPAEAPAPPRARLARALGRRPLPGRHGAGRAARLRGARRGGRRRRALRPRRHRAARGRLGARARRLPRPPRAPPRHARGAGGRLLPRAHRLRPAPRLPRGGELVRALPRRGAGGELRAAGARQARRGVAARRRARPRPRDGAHLPRPLPLGPPRRAREAGPHAVAIGVGGAPRRAAAPRWFGQPNPGKGAARVASEPHGWPA
ncbi:MAG: FecR domain-containing protein [Deltaproteobacteria bacterium]|nr:FecR domain-containing protein [Deltaproteobacteria bacterium]